VFDEENTYSFLQNPADASLVTVKMIFDSTLHFQLPSNVVNPAEIDYVLMEKMSGPIAAANYDFDSLLVPFRCLASDITAKTPIVFGKGDLSQAVRSSMAFPFYFSPVLIGDNILYDGGIYNNFPVDVMLNTFDPDVIIGVSAAGLPEFPSEGNFLSQLKTMITHNTRYDVTREQDLLIEPLISDLGTFEFDAIQAAIDSGYSITKRMMPEIRQRITRRINVEELKRNRQRLTQNSYSITVDRIFVYGVNEEQGEYIRSVLNPRNECLNLQQLRRNYFKLVADDNQRYLFPRLIYNPGSGDFDLHLDVRKTRGFAIDFGGTVSSRPINTGFVGIQHNLLGRQSLRINGNIYFGKLYNSGHIRMRLDVPGRVPFFIEPSATFNQFDFYKSSGAFFEDVKPSFLVQSERMYALQLGLPVRNKGKVIAGISSFRNEDDYYFTRQFSSEDTSDQTSLQGYSTSLYFERNSLNRKMYASEGNQFEIKARYNFADELYRPGSTRIVLDTVIETHYWFQVQIRFDHYIKTSSFYKAGILTELNFSSMPFLSNYISTKSQTQAFQPIPEMQTQFLETYRAHNWAGFGVKNIFSLSEDLDIRLEGYAFQPFQEILQGKNFKPAYGETFARRFFVGTFNTVYNSPLGPISLALNYIDDRDKPWSVMFHFGYILFNRRSLQ
jgi:NTE family protein